MRISVTGNTQPGNGTVVVNPDGTYTYTPNDDFSGDDSFTVTVTDSAGNSSTSTVTVTVGEAPNLAPDAIDDTIGTNFETPVSGNVLDNDSDPEGDTLTVAGNTDPANGTVVVNEDGTFTYTPNDGFSGDDSFTVTITDPSGNTDTSTVTVSVAEAANEGPDAVDDGFDTDFETPVSGNVLDNDSDPEGDPLTVVGNTDPISGTVEVNEDGTFTYTPNDGFSGDDSFDVTVSDPFGNEDTSTVTVSVAPDLPPTNLPPDAVADAVGTDFETAVSGNVLTNDSDPEGQQLTVIGNTAPGNGSVAVGADGTFTYTPAPGFSGTDTFSYTVADSEGDTDTTSVTVVVGTPPPPPVNLGPDAVDDTVGTEFGTPVSGSVLGNDSDPEADPLTITGNTTPANGALVFNADGTFTYTPNDGFSGTDTFTYTITDGNGNVDTATVTINVDEPAVFSVGDTSVSEGRYGDDHHHAQR